MTITLAALDGLHGQVHGALETVEPAAAAQALKEGLHLLAELVGSPVPVVLVGTDFLRHQLGADAVLKVLDGLLFVGC